MGKIIGEYEIGDDALATMQERGGTWAAYQCMALDSRNIGTMRFLKVGAGCTYETAPQSLPDSQFGTGWSFQLVGMVDLEKGVIDDN